jgi:hypothetical protein
VVNVDVVVGDGLVVVEGDVGLYVQTHKIYFFLSLGLAQLSWEAAKLS